MSPTKFQNEQHPRKEINGPRPSPLKINKDSHFINKPPSAAKQQHPVIIYTHSPKIIHTQARDFMALVQKLTGLSSTSDTVQKNAPLRQQDGVRPSSSRDDDESSSVLTDEHYGGGGGGGGGCGDGQRASSSSVSPMLNNAPQYPNYLADIPLFTPNSTDFFCSPRRFYRYLA